MANLIAYTILAAIVGSAAWFINRELGNAIDDAFDDFADDTRPSSLLTSVPSFHGEGF